MVKMTFSFKTHTGMTNLHHNNRELTEKEKNSDAHKHITHSLSHENITILKKSIHQVYQEEFEASLNVYNAKQKRKDRIIKDYYKHVQKSKTLDLQREFVVSVGNKDDWDSYSFEDKKRVGHVLANYVSDFNNRHKHFVVYNAVVHLDEAGAPHAHINVVPVADGYQNGVAKKPSFSKALLQEGFKEKGRGQLKEFRDYEIGKLAEFMKSLGIERKLGQTNNIKDMREYKQTMAYIEEEGVKKRESFQREISDLEVKKLKMSEQIDDMISRAEKKLYDLRRDTAREEERNALVKKELEKMNAVDRIKSKFVQKDIDHALEIAEELTEKRTEELKKQINEAYNRETATKKQYNEVVQKHKKWANGYQKLAEKVTKLQSQVTCLQTENSYLKHVIRVFQRAFDKVETFLKNLGYWKGFKFSYREDNKSQYDEFQKYRHDNELYADNQKRTVREQNWFDR